MNEPSIAGLWRRIHAWAEAHAPAMLEDLSASADAADLAALRALDLPIPEALLASLAEHDGEDESSWGKFLAGGGRLLSARGIVAHRQMLAEVQASLRAGLALSGVDLEDDSGTGIGPVRALNGHERWLPIIDLNGDVTWYLDFDPLLGGAIGQVIRVDLEGTEWVVCAPSFAAFLADYADALEAGRIGVEDGELVGESPWPPLTALPAFAPGRLDRAALEQLVAAGRSDIALELAARMSPPLRDDERLRLEARAAHQQGDLKLALAALEQLRQLGQEGEDDLWLRLEALDAHGRDSDIMAELGLAIPRFDSARLWHRRAELQRKLAESPPFKASAKKAMAWLASPAGQQHAAVARERAVADLRAALARDDRDDWQLDLGECLLDAERWDEAEAVFAALAERIEAGERSGADNEDHLEQALEGVERAQRRGEGESEEMLQSIDDLLALVGGADGELPEALKEMVGLRDQFAQLMQAERSEKAERAAAPSRLDVDAARIAEQLAQRHRDLPERYVAFDPPLADKKALRHYDRAQAALEALGYRLLADVEPLRNTEMSGQRVLLRLLLSADQAVVAAVWRVANAFTAVEAIELESWLEDGSVLLTGNTGSANPFEAPTGILQECLPQGTNAKQLEDVHRRRLGARAARPLPDMAAVTALQEAQRQLKREHARRAGWVSESELRGLLGASYAELAPRVRAELQRLIG
jgi:cell wall assembly regulator SMI1